MRRFASAISARASSSRTFGETSARARRRRGPLASPALPPERSAGWRGARRPRGRARPAGRPPPARDRSTRGRRRRARALGPSRPPSARAASAAGVRSTPARPRPPAGRRAAGRSPRRARAAGGRSGLGRPGPSTARRGGPAPGRSRPGCPQDSPTSVRCDGGKERVRPLQALLVHGANHAQSTTVVAGVRAERKSDKKRRSHIDRERPAGVQMRRIRWSLRVSAVPLLWGLPVAGEPPRVGWPTTRIPPKGPAPLRGRRAVLDLSRVLAGPLATMILGDLGADVIKVERPGEGDDTRHWGPPFVGDDAAYYLSLNRNKRSVTPDLETPEGVVASSDGSPATSDVLIENFRPGPDGRARARRSRTSAQEHPRLVTCSLTASATTRRRRPPGPATTSSSRRCPA